jgi:hypothetical protein
MIDFAENVPMKMTVSGEMKVYHWKKGLHYSVTDMIDAKTEF